MKIEQVHAGTVVWSRDEFTHQEGWKRVQRTFITHPSELYRLTYEVRGPPEGGAGMKAPVHTVAAETLGVTAPHPFWVCSRKVPGFVMAEELREGDELLTADGRRAEVTGKVLELAPEGGTFTTYNFEVEDYHTYFAGRSAVWVHNQSLRPCQLARSGIESMVNRGEATWDAFKGTLTKFTYDDIGHRTRLQIFNETRSKYFNDKSGKWTTGLPTWNEIGAQKTRLVVNAQIDGAEKARQIAGQVGSSRKLKANLKATGVDLPYEDGKVMAAAHHIVLAGDNKFPSSRDARKLLADAGIDINEAANDVFLPVKAEFSDLGKAVHVGSHPEKYSQWVKDRLLPHAGNADALRKELQMIAADLVEIGWP